MTTTHMLAIRPATRDDAQAIANVVIATELIETGVVDTVPEDLLEWWDDETVDLANNTRVLITPEDTIIGYAGLSQDSHGFGLDPHTHVHPDYQQRNLEHFLLQLIEEQARHMLEQSSIPPVIHATSFHPTWTEVLKQEGYSITSSDIRMEIKLNEAPPAPLSIPAIAIRPYQPGKEELAIHAVIQEAFQDIGGRPYIPFEDWEVGTLQRSSFDPSLLYVAVEGDTIFGAIICRSFPEALDVPQGHISQLGVLRPWRKRGIALQLLYTVFGEYYQRGLTHLILDVDTHNTSGAHQLYQRAGLRKQTQVDNLQKTL